jgi:hypothetical protein
MFTLLGVDQKNEIIDSLRKILERPWGKEGKCLKLELFWLYQRKKLFILLCFS